MAKIFGQIEKAQLENLSSDPSVSALKGYIFFNTTSNVAKVANGTIIHELIDGSSTQTMSAKTLTTPTIASGMIVNQIATPANPSAGAQKLYFKSDGKLYSLDSSGNEAQIGSGGTGGVKNLITNGNADDTASSIFTAYADAAATRPVDGTGGSPTVTTSVTTSSPLDGTKSFLLTKPASNVQGQGWAVPFTVDLAYRAKALKISVDVIVNSGTFAAGNNSASPVDGDVIWYIYDVTNSQLIEPSNIKMFSDSATLAQKFEATFQSSATGSSYRLIAHVASTSASAFELKVDNVTVSPQIYVYGTPVTDWADFTPTGNWTNTTYTGKYRYVGDEIELVYHLKLTGAPSGSLNLNVPSFAPINTSKLPASGDNLRAVGTWVTEDNGVQDYGGVAYLNPGSNLIGGLLNPTTGGIVTATAPYSFNTGDWIEFKISYPVNGKSSSVQVSDSADTRVVAARYTGTTTPAPASLTPSIIPLVSKVEDTHGAYNTSTGLYTVPVAGLYEVTFQTHASQAAGAVSNAFDIAIYKNGSSIASKYETAFTTTSVEHSPTITATVSCKAGDTIAAYIGQNLSGGTITLSNNIRTYLDIKRISGPSAIAASELVAMSYENNSGTSITTSNATITFSTKNFDTHNAYSGGVFTAPVSGKYFVSLNMFSVTTLSNTAGWYAKIVKNGSVSAFVNTKAGTGAPNTTNCVSVSGVVELKAGDTLRVDSNLDAAGPISLTASAGYNVFTIAKIGVL